jgi:hypothetical protein
LSLTSGMAIAAHCARDSVAQCFFWRKMIFGWTMKTLKDADRRGALISTAAVVWCIACPLTVPSVTFADEVPLATYTLIVQVDNAAPQTVSNTVVPNTVASVNTLQSSSGTQLVGTALASTFTPLFAQVQGEADATPTAPPSPPNIIAEGSTITYYFQVEQTAPAPVDVVPLVIDGNLEADASAVDNGAANAVALFAIPVLNISSQALAMCNGKDCPNPSSSFHFIDLASATAGRNIQVQILTSGDAGAFGSGAPPFGSGGHATFQGIADPAIQIDPSFAFAGDFTIAFSSNLTSSAAVPEPSSIALLATGLLALMAVLRSNQVRRRFED